jgi:TRAP-type C4-dicarboxylate transport system substrate-binding protein
MRVRVLRHLVIVALAALPAIASAEPVDLKLAFFSSDRSILYQSAIKPFVDAVNAEGKGIVHVDVYFSSALGPVAEEPRLLHEGKFDLAFMAPGYSPDLFYDDDVVELPGLFHNSGEATYAYTHLIAGHAIKSYDDLFVVGAYASEPESVHSQRPIPSLAALKGLKIRSNNVMEAAALKELGAEPVAVPINKTAEAVSSRAVDGAMSPSAMLFEFGIGRVTSSHYMLRSSAALMLLAMERSTLEKLPVAAQQIIRKYSGDWTASRYISIIEAANVSVLNQLAADPRRSVVSPSAADQAIAQRAFDHVMEQWVGTNKERRKQLDLLRAEIANLRLSE